MPILLEKLVKNHYIDNEDTYNIQDINGTNIKKIEKQTEDSVINIYLYTICDASLEKAEDVQLENIKIDLLKIYDEVLSEKTASVVYIMFFNWKKERKILKQLRKICNNASEKRKINSLFTSMKSIYSDISSEVSLKVDKDGINFLEYAVNDFKVDNFSDDENLKKYDINSNIYNISMFELQRLFNMIGSKLFKMNVRIGISDKKSGRDLREEFKKYLKVGLIRNGYIGKDNHLSEANLGLDEGDISSYAPELFWFGHNGVNIYIDDNGEFDEEGSVVSIDPGRVSVINGAQTLTNFFMAKDELVTDLSEELDVEESKLEK